MRARFDAIVIGSGLGGSTAAAVLAAAGRRVLVLEKNTRLGGICAAYDKGGFRVDIGTHMFTRGRRGPFGSIAKRVGAQLPRFRQGRDAVRFVGLGVDVSLPNQPWRLPAALLDAHRQVRLGPRELAAAYRLFCDVLRADAATIAELDQVNVYDYVCRYTSSPRVMGSFGLLLGLYFILPLREVSAGEAIWCFQQMVRDNALSYPEGGAEAVPLAFLNAARAHGADIRCGKHVQRIVIDGGHVTGVECAGGEAFAAPVVVATTSLRDVVDGLAGAEHFPAAYRDRVRGLTSSLVAVQAKFALKRRVFDAAAFVGACAHDGTTFATLKLGDLEQGVEDVRDGRLPKITPIYAPIPSNCDPALAPPGCQIVTACALAPTLDIDLKAPPHAWVDTLVQSVYRLVPEVERALLWVDTSDVRFIERWIGKQYAPAISCGQTPDQVGWRRPPVRTPVPGLYVAGCGAGGRGVGTELAATSGELAADAALTDTYNGLIDAPVVPTGANKGVDHGRKIHEVKRGRHAPQGDGAEAARKVRHA